MALRPMLYASSLAPLLAAAAGRDGSFVERVVQHFPPEMRATARTAATALLSHESAGKPESDDEVDVVWALASVLGLQERDSIVADGDWKNWAWEDYLLEVREHLSARGQELFGYLTEQTRPLFGTSIETTWSYYGYLHNSEVRELLTALEKVHEAHPDIARENFIDGFHGVLLGWLGEVLRRQTDLWLFAS